MEHHQEGGNAAGRSSSLVALLGEAAAVEESVGASAVEPGPAVDHHHTCSLEASLLLKTANVSQHIWTKCSSFIKIVCEKNHRGLITLLRHSVVVHGRLRWITAAAILLLSSVHLRVSSHRIVLLRMPVSHGSHTGSCHATKSSAHAVAHSTASTRWVATARTVVGCPINTNGASVKSVHRL